jgi:hypothetical protein
MQFMCRLQKAVGDDVARIQKEFDQHKRQADIGYAYRKQRKSESKAMWVGTALPARSVVSFPPPPASVCIGAHSDKHDFTECDMGGGRRTPLIRQGPQYYLRTLPSKPYYICSTVRGDVAFWWNESIANFGANDICSVNYLYDTVFGTGAGARTYFVDGTAAQAWNKTMFAYCLDCVNPESPTFNNDPAISLYSRIDMYRNPPGHTFMRPDATHGQVSRYGKSLAYVCTTRDWAERVTKECRGEASKIDSIFMEQSYFRKWKCYLRQMYRSSVLTTTNQESFRLLDYYWVNFGWGRRCTDGQLIHHPQEMWLYTCHGDVKDEWYKESPVKVVLPQNFKADGSLPIGELKLVQWLRAKGKSVVPLNAAEFQAYLEPIPLELAKQWDLRTLSTFLPPPITQEEIDIWYPEPCEGDPHDVHDNLPDVDDDEEGI